MVMVPDSLVVRVPDGCGVLLAGGGRVPEVQVDIGIYPVGQGREFHPGGEGAAGFREVLDLVGEDGGAAGVGEDDVVPVRLGAGGEVGVEGEADEDREVGLGAGDHGPVDGELLPGDPVAGVDDEGSGAAAATAATAAGSAVAGAGGAGLGPVADEVAAGGAGSAVAGAGGAGLGPVAEEVAAAGGAGSAVAGAGGAGLPDVAGAVAAGGAYPAVAGAGGAGLGPVAGAVPAAGQVSSRLAGEAGPFPPAPGDAAGGVFEDVVGGDVHPGEGELDGVELGVSGDVQVGDGTGGSGGIGAGGEASAGGDFMEGAVPHVGGIGACRLDTEVHPPGIFSGHEGGVHDAGDLARDGDGAAAAHVGGDGISLEEDLPDVDHGRAVREGDADVGRDLGGGTLVLLEEDAAELVVVGLGGVVEVIGPEFDGTEGEGRGRDHGGVGVLHLVGGKDPGAVACRQPEVLGVLELGGDAVDGVHEVDLVGGRGADAPVDREAGGHGSSAHEGGHGDIGAVQGPGGGVGVDVVRGDVDPGVPGRAVDEHAPLLQEIGRVELDVEVRGRGVHGEEDGRCTDGLAHLGSPAPEDIGVRGDGDVLVPLVEGEDRPGSRRAEEGEEAEEAGGLAAAEGEGGPEAGGALPGHPEGVDVQLELGEALLHLGHLGDFLVPAQGGHEIDHIYGDGHDDDGEDEEEAHDFVDTAGLPALFFHISGFHARQTITPG